MADAEQELEVNNINPYLSEEYDKQTLWDLLRLTQSSLDKAIKTTPQSPKIEAYNITIQLISMALIFKKR